MKVGGAGKLSIRHSIRIEILEMLHACCIDVVEISTQREAMVGHCLLEIRIFRFGSESKAGNGFIRVVVQKDLSNVL